MKSFSKVVVCLLLVALFLASGVAWSRTPIRDGDPGTIGACLTQPDGSRITLPCEEVIRCGRSGKSFAIKEWFEPQPAKPRLAVVSTRPLPVKEYWNVDVTGILSTFSGVSRDGSEIRQRVLIVSPENVTVYCSPNGKPVPFMPIKGLDMDWPCKRSLADLASEGSAETASVSVMSEGDLPPMPDGLDSESPPVYCATIAEAKAQTDGTAVELQCKPMNSATSGSFVMGEDDTYDTLTTYYTGTVVADDRVNKVTGTIHTSGSDKVLDVDSGPGFDPDGYIGSVQTVAQGTIAWAKTFADGLYLTADLSGKVVSRTFPALGYFCVQEPSRACGIRVNDSASAESLHAGDIVTISGGEMTTVDGERAINYAYTQMDSSGDAPRPLGLNNKAVGGGDLNVLTQSPAGGTGTNNVGLLVRAWGKVTATGSGYFYIDDGSNLSDGSGSTGVCIEGVITYMPDIDDYVAVTGISGLKTVSSNPARVVRVASSSDFTPITPAAPDGLEAYATGTSTIRLYWPATPGATGYNIYRGLTSGGEDYDNPLNGSTPVTDLTYLDTDLTEDIEYFYTIKALSSSGISQPSDENSAVPYAGAVPWGGSVYDVTSAVQARVSVYADYVRVCGPDGTIYDSTQPTPQSPDGSVTEGTNLFVHSSGQVFPLPGDGAVVSSSGQEDGGYGILSAGWTPVELNGHSYGPYRRVSSRQESGHYYFGAGGNFVLPDRNGISLRGNKTTPYIYLGSHAQDMTYGPSWVEVDAGLMWNRNFFRNTWDAYLFTNTAGKKSFGRARVNMGLGSSFRFMGGMSVYMAYWISFDTSILVIEGFDEYFNYKTVIVANAYGAMWYPAAIIKRAHSYATGSPDEYRNGSYVWGAEVSDMVLYHFATGGGTEAVWWTKDRTPPPPSGHQWPWPWVSGCYPAPSVGEVTWRETDAYVSEDRINIGP